MLCYIMWNLFTVCSLQYPNDSTIASLEANQNRPIRIWYQQIKKQAFVLSIHF